MAKKSNLKCIQCNKEFSTQQALKQHIEATNHKSYGCPNCKKAFSTKQSRDQHISSVHTKKIIKCPSCNKKYNSKESLNQHISAVHRIKCPHCELSFLNQAQLSKHILNTHQNKLKETFICHECKKVFKSKNSLDQHKKSVNHQIKQLDSLKCPECHKKFGDRNALKQHMKSHSHSVEKATDTTQFKCPQCNKEFNTNKSLAHHFSAKHKKKDKVKIIKKKGIALFERRTLMDRMRKYFHRLFRKKRIIIMDECVGNDASVIDALKENYEICSLPKELKSHSDKNLRLALAGKKWGLVSKDYEMVMIAKEMNINPVYLLTEKRDHRDLIRISKRNYRVS